MLTGCIQDWPALWREAYRCLKPGGWIQSQESQARIDSDDDTIPEKSAMAQWEKLFVSGGKIMNRTFTMIDDGLQRPEIEKAGFVNVNETNLKVSYRHVLPHRGPGVASISHQSAPRSGCCEYQSSRLTITGPARKLAERPIAQGGWDLCRLCHLTGCRGLCHLHGGYAGVVQGRDYRVFSAYPARTSEPGHPWLV